MYVCLRVYVCKYVYVCVCVCARACACLRVCLCSALRSPHQVRGGTRGAPSDARVHGGGGSGSLLQRRQLLCLQLAQHGFVDLRLGEARDCGWDTVPRNCRQTRGASPGQGPRRRQVLLQRMQLLQLRVLLLLVLLVVLLLLQCLLVLLLLVLQELLLLAKECLLVVRPLSRTQQLGTLSLQLLLS